MDQLGSMLGGGEGGGDLAGALGGLIGGQGGLQGLVNQLGEGGLKDVVASWVGTGANGPLNPAQLGAALGPDKVQQLAGKAGLPVETFLPILAGLLPAIIDKLTPGGHVPSGDATAGLDIGGLLGSLAGGAGSGSGSPLDALGGLLGGSKG